MVKVKSQSKKSQKRGVDFKKIKRKVGRKLPPPKNATNTEVKSKAIILPEQTIASEKSGLATSRKGLTLKELLQQTSHHNAKVRKEALLGIKDVLINHPAELKLHKLAVVEKLRERIGDDDKLVRETLHQLFKSVIFPGCTKDNQGPFVSLIMAYVFNAMTHLAVDVRMMAYKFVDLIVQFYPSSFSLYADKILRNYEDILHKSQFLRDKGQLKSVLSGLVRCLSLLPCDDREDCPKTDNDIPMHNVLHAFEPDIIQDLNGLKEISNILKDMLLVLIGCIKEFLPLMNGVPRLDVQSFDCLQLILQSVDFIVKFVAYDTCEKQSVLQPLLRDQQAPPSMHAEFISPMIFKKLSDVFPLTLANDLSGKDNERIFILNMLVTQVFLRHSSWNSFPPDLMVKLMEFIETALFSKIPLGKTFYDKHLRPVICYIPKLAMEISGGWRVRILNVFTVVFMNCSPDSSMKLACLSAIQEMLSPERNWLCEDVDDPSLSYYRISWIRRLPSLLMSLDAENPTCSKAVLQIILNIGRTAPVNSPLSEEFDKIQFTFGDFFSSQNGEVIFHGPFFKLAEDIQEIAICCLYYFTIVDFMLLKSLLSCCLGNELEPHLVARILEVLHSSFSAGHIQVADYASFHVTLLSQFRVYPENVSPASGDGNSYRKTYRTITRIICSCLSQMGDNHLVFQMLEKLIVDQICGKIPMENKCSLLRLLVVLDSKPTRLSDQSISNISLILPQQLMDIISSVCDHNEADTDVSVKRRLRYLLPFFHLFCGSENLWSHVLNVMVSWICELSSSLESHHSNISVERICSIGLLLSDMHKDTHARRVLLLCKSEVETMLQSLNTLLLSEGKSLLTSDEKGKIGNACERLKVIVSSPFKTVQ